MISFYNNMIKVKNPLFTKISNMSEIAQRRFTQTCAKLNERAVEIHSKLVSLLIDIQQLLGDSVIFKWEEQMLKMTLGQGPLSQKQLVRGLIKDDRRVTYDILEILTSLG